MSCENLLEKNKLARAIESKKLGLITHAYDLI